MIKQFLSILKNIWRSKFIRKFIPVFSIIFTVSILTWLIYTQWDILQTQILNINPLPLLISFLIYSVILFITSSIWSQIMNALGHKVPFLSHFVNFCISALGKRLPGTFWYVAWRANLYQEDKYPPKLVVLTSGIETLVIVIAALIVSVFFSIPLIRQFRYSLIGFLIIIIGILVFLHPKINKWIFNKLNVDPRKFDYKQLLLWCIQYIIVWLLVGGLLFTFANIFKDLSFSELGYFIGATALTGVLSRLFLFLPSQFGFGEISLSLLLSGIMPISLAAIIAISNRIIIIFFEIVWALLAISVKRIYKSK